MATIPAKMCLPIWLSCSWNSRVSLKQKTGSAGWSTEIDVAEFSNFLESKYMSDVIIDSVRILNNGTEKTMILEPWAEEVLLPKGANYRIVCDGAITGVLEIELTDDYVIVYGLVGSSLKVMEGSKLVWESFERLP